MESGPTLRRALSTRVPGLRALALGLALAGCGMLDSPATTLVPRSDFGWISHRIFLQILRWDTAIFLVVQALLLFAVFRFRERDPKAIPRQVRGSAMLELIWTVLPAVILVFIAFPTVAAIFRTQAEPPKDALRITVIGHQWWWEFQYPDLGIVTATDLHLPAGRTVSLEIVGADVIHSFWVPQLGGKRDAIPGSTTRIVLTADTPGEYYGQCAEFCGASHANMRHLAVVDTPEAFTAWVAQQKLAAQTPPDGSRRALVFRSTRPARASGATPCAAYRRAASDPTSRTSARARPSPAGCCRTRPRTWRAGSGTRRR
jgi:cytochrome c oxidase subunit 2